MASAETILKTVEKVCEVDPTGVGVAISGSLAEIIKAARVRSNNILYISGCSWAIDHDRE
jgi:hypothetical protein